jgi:hypothetical protein
VSRGQSHARRSTGGMSLRIRASGNASSNGDALSRAEDDLLEHCSAGRKMRRTDSLRREQSPALNLRGRVQVPGGAPTRFVVNARRGRADHADTASMAALRAFGSVPMPRS